MKILFYRILNWLGINRESDIVMLRNGLVRQRHEFETRIQHLEGDVRRLCTMLRHDQVNVTTDATLLKEHFNTIVRESVEESYDFDALVSDAVEDFDFSDAVDDAFNAKDWDDVIRDNLDHDKVADKVMRDIDWSELISENDIITRDELDPDDVMLKSDQMSDDEVMTREDMSNEVISELKRDWFKTMLKEEVVSLFKATLYDARETEHANALNAIDDEIQTQIGVMISQRMEFKFGEEWDSWYNENTRHCVKVILGEFLASAYEQTKENEGKDNA